MSSTKILVLICLTLIVFDSQATEVPHYKLLLSVSEDSLDKLGLALNTSKNVQILLGPSNVDIEVVFYGPAVRLLKWYTPTIVADKIKLAKYSGVRFVACKNSMHAAMLKPTDMLQEVRYVEGGVVEILEKTAEGWTHIRP